MSWLNDIENRVVTAYNEKGYKAREKTFHVLNEDDGTTRCCALTAVFGKADHLHRGGLIGSFAERAGATDAEIWDFIYGFDLTLQDQPYEETTAAAEAGKRTARLVKEAGLY